MSRRYAGLPLLMLTTGVCCAPALAQARHRYTVTPVVHFVHPGDPPLHMPTGVAVSSTGAVYVVDGVNDRLLEFAPDGAFRGTIQKVGVEPLTRPLSAHFDSAGRLWIADAGAGRVLVRNPDGSLFRQIALAPAQHRFEAGATAPAPLTTQPAAPEVTDVALSPDGRIAWLADNHAHQLIRYDLERDEFTRIGERGPSLGQFQYPFSIAVGPTGDVAVTDVINGRVQLLTAAGRLAGVITTFGVELGQTYRPKGVAFGPHGNVWVADGTIGVVQVFTIDGRLIDCVRNERGEPYRFELPMGLAFDQQGELYVVELAADRVLRMHVETDPTAPPASAGRRPTGPAGGPQAHGCTVCHLEWMIPLVEGRGTALIQPPPNPPAAPAVSRSRVCLGCHDGSVGDDRRKVWVEHGHRTNIPPPPGMAVPQDLPLTDGRIACRTCHSAHGPQSGQTLETIVFLRIGTAAPSTLCLKCHTDLAAGPAAGSHPLSEMPIPTPAALVRDPAAAGPAAVTCMTCHAGHGAVHDHLLVLNPDNNALCLTCHVPLQPALFSDETRSRHGRMPVLDPAQSAVAGELATRISPAGELLCLTCHMMHKARPPAALLAFDPAGGETCSACHGLQRNLVGSVHDLRNNHPQAENIRGVTVEAGGPCSACHTAHQYARTPLPTALDPTGRCMACHAPGQLAETTQLPPVNHPQAACGECHNPHEPRFGKFLAGPPFEQCRECHADYLGLIGGPHDVQRGSSAWPEVSRAAADICLACHRIHGTEEIGLFRAGRAAGALFDPGCIACHQAAAPAAGGDRALLHTISAARLKVAPTVPLATQPAGPARIACHTCHNPHQGPAGAAALLRVPPDAPTAQLCTDCHKDMLNIRAIGHAEQYIRQAGFRADGCQPCHRIHADPQTVRQRYLWPLQLWPPEIPTQPAAARPATQPAATPAETPAVPQLGAGLATAADGFCLACHREGGPVSPPAVATHPEVAMFNPAAAGAPGFLPLFNERGDVDPQGRISCQTCHLTHGRATPEPLPPATAGGELSAREVRARQYHLRTFVSDNVCATCHGFDALRRYIYFHTPALRGGPVQPQPSAPPP